MPPSPVKPVNGKPQKATLATYLERQLRDLAEVARTASGEEFSNGKDEAATSWRVFRTEILALIERLPETEIPAPENQKR